VPIALVVLMALLVPWLGFAIAFVTTQSRFYDAWFERNGGPDRRQRSRLFWTHPLEYLRLLRKPPFTLGSMFQRLDDPVVDSRRRHYLFAGIAAFAYFPALFVALIVGLVVYGTPVVK
jgi:hypothetical protein